MPGPFNICDGLAFENSVVHVEFQKGNPLHRRAACLIPEKHDSTHQERLEVSRVTQANLTIILTACNCSRFASHKFPFALIFTGTWHCCV